MTKEILAFLKQKIGLEASTVGSRTVERAIRSRVIALRLKDTGEYWAFLKTSTDELNELIDAVVVRETWFFRDEESFAMLARWVSGDWLAAHPSRVLRILSVPCSTGEEPYSAAMALLDAGISPLRFEIDGVDISPYALDRAKGAIYGNNSFRTKDSGFQDRHFTKTPKGYALAERVRRQVKFQRGNLTAIEFLPGEEVYDIIFCRNVLIYFDRPTQELVAGVLKRLLAAKGLLFVGRSESALMLSCGFVPCDRSTAGVCRKPSPGPAGGSAPPPSRPSLPPRARAAGPASAPPPRPAPFSSVPAASGRKASKRAMTGLDLAGQLADRGLLEEARGLCEAYLREDSLSAPAHFLLGTVLEAVGHTKSAYVAYSKAAYLDPDNYDVLAHLSLLAEKLGESDRAKHFSARAQRAKERLKV